MIVGNNGVLYTSSDATTWTYRNSNTTKNLIGVCYGNNKFVAGGSSGITTYSTDGINWTSNQTESPYDFNAICYGDNEFKMVGAGGSLLSSQDGVNWQSEPNPYTTGHYRCVIYDGSKYYAAYDATSKNVLVKLNKLSDVLKFISAKM